MGKMNSISLGVQLKSVRPGGVTPGRALRNVAPAVSCAAKIRVAIVDNDGSVRHALRLVLEDSGIFEVSCMATGGDEALFKVPFSNVEIVLMAVRMKGMSGITCARDLLRLIPTIKVVMLTASTEASDFLRAIAVGAAGYVVKPFKPNRLVETLRFVHSGRLVVGGEWRQIGLRALFALADELCAPNFKLSPREREVINLVSEGLTDGEISAELRIALTTVKTHLRNVYLKLRTPCRAGAVRMVFGRHDAPRGTS
jgi:DNA-binding NarL/FixJ family response regulator